MEQWQQSVSRGNSAFSEGRDDDAIHLYEKACQRALQLLPHWVDTEAAIAALVISYQNIADVYFRRSDFPQAIKTYQNLYQQLKFCCLTHVDTPDTMIVFDCACRRAGAELGATIKRLGALGANDKELVNDFFELKSQPTFNLTKEYIQ